MDQKYKTIDRIIHPELITSSTDDNLSIKASTLKRKEITIIK
jgi:hypothetical protein